MKALGMFLLRFLGIVLIVLFAFWAVSLIWGNFVSPECPECVCPETEQVVPTTSDTPSGDVTFSQEEVVCKFADGYTSEGKTVPKGTKVTGPALIKPNRDTDHVILLMQGAEYTTEATDETVWILIGDNACVDAQAQFFGSSETINNN
jgi:hypothetical protein